MSAEPIPVPPLTIVVRATDALHRLFRSPGGTYVIRTALDETVDPRRWSGIADRAGGRQEKASLGVSAGRGGEGDGTAAVVAGKVEGEVGR